MEPVMPMDLADNDLISRSLQGDKAAFAQLVRKYTPVVYAKAMLLTHNPHDAEDLTQETFLKAFSKLHLLQDAEAFGPWVLTINRNLAFSKYRKEEREFTVTGDSQAALLETAAETARPQGDTVFRALDGNQTRMQLLSAINELPEQYRVPILLHYMEGMPYKDIQVKLNLSTGALKGMISRGVVQLRSLVRRMKVAVD